MPPVRRVLGSVALALTFVVGACSSAGDGSAPARTTAPASTYEPVSGRVVVVGDSLTVGTEENLGKLAGLHGFDLELSAANGREIPAGVDELQRLDAATAEVVVVALGTNDAAQAGFSSEQAAARIDDAMAAAGSAPVLWVNVYRDPGTAAGDAARLFNGELAEAEQRHPNLTTLDWAAFVADHPEVMAADRIHHTWDGYVARSQWLRDEIVSRLRSSTAAVPTSASG
jgi:lysophospholipase L1-like esterase